MGSKKVDFCGTVAFLFEIDYNNLKLTIDKYLHRKINDTEIEENIALVLENSSEFKCGAVDMDANLISEVNINGFVNALRNQLIQSD